MKVNIRRMTMEDVPKVHQIEQACFAIPWSQKSFEKEMNQNPCARYLVAETGEDIIAYAGAWLILQEGHITNIAVLPQYRKMGIGQKVTQALLQYAANLGVQYVTLEVRRSNIAAQKLYEKLGFIKVGERKKYYEDNQEDAFIMVNDKLPPEEETFQEAETVFD